MCRQKSRRYRMNEEIDWLPGKKSEAPTTAKKESPISYVDEPQHYQIFPDTQVIDIIRNSLTLEEFKGFCKGNILKYRLRDKGNINEDFEKSKKYVSYLEDI